MKLLLLRRWLTDKSTVGELFINPTDEGTRGFQCYTLEDPYLGDETKVPGKSCVPCGEYQVEFRWSPKLKKDLPVFFTRKQGPEPYLYIIESPLKKVRFEQCMFHVGNDADDVEGCVAVGQERDPDHVRLSTPALAELLQRLRYALGKAETISLTIALSTGAHAPQ